MTHARLYAPHSSVAEPSPALWEWIACIAVVTMMTGIGLNRSSAFSL